MAELNLSNEDITELLTVLNVALYDAQALAGQSHDTDEIQAYEEHRATIRKWITRLSKQIGSKEEKSETPPADQPFFSSYLLPGRPSEEEQTAIRDWHTRARVRIKETTTKHSFDGEHTFQAGDVLVMFQWGRAGRPVDRGAWWTSYDIDGAWIVESSLVEVVEVLDEVSPFD